MAEFGLGTFGGGDYGLGSFSGGGFAQDLLDALAPMLYAENETNHALGTYLTGLSRPFELVESWASDTDTEPGWSLLLDIDRCPDEALPWLAQLCGIKLAPGLSASNQRAQIDSLASFKRGTPSAIKAAPLPYLTGTKSVTLRERYDGSANDAPNHLQVLVLDTEVVDSVAAEAATRAQKPAGNIMTFTILTGQDYQHIKDTYTSYQDVKNAYHTYQGVKLNQPGV